ncbi:ornithine cyclodeaminase [Annulohypoxylon maeteangense]|uniref:ornithine cyclodeaminase n=1 Tax=Annulohypoxylon maeteangense TaxID=1927788 RepID=UPI0020075293|nr:ornithine cyclodeaminase [Annulohypoxylon maeteangense]KAI0888211.1 ornithine cyclodeaminase [Annulohypoxylon maeteangense]
MSLTVLSDEQIRYLLENLSHEEAGRFMETLQNALHEYSTGTQSIADGVVHQPERTSVHSNTTGTTTLFMPSYSTLGHAVKVVTLSSPSADPALPAITPTGSVTLYSPQGPPLGFLNAKTLTAFRTALASSCLLMKRASVRTLTVFGSGLQAYWHIRLALMLRGDTIRQVYIINRRFSESARDTFKKIYGIHTEIKQREGWEKAQFSLLTPGYGEFDRLQRDHLRAADVIYCCTPSTKDLFDASILTSHEGRRKGRLIVAVGSYTPQMHELPRELLLQATKNHVPGHLHYHKHATEGGVIVVDTLDGALKEAGEIIEAGLEPKQLVELGELVMIHRLAKEEEEESLASQSSTETSSINDSLEKLDITSSGTAMSTVFGSESGSGSKRSCSRSPSRRGSSSGQSRPSYHRRSSSQLVSEDQEHKKSQPQSRDNHLSRWLSVGNVIYKSVGLGLMDLVVGFEIVRLAKERDLGSHVEGFSS